MRNQEANRMRELAFSLYHERERSVKFGDATDAAVAESSQFHPDNIGGARKGTRLGSRALLLSAAEEAMRVADGSGMLPPSAIELTPVISVIPE